MARASQEVALCGQIFYKVLELFHVYFFQIIAVAIYSTMEYL